MHRPRYCANHVAWSVRHNRVTCDIELLGRPIQPIFRISDINWALRFVTNVDFPQSAAIVVMR